MSDKPFVSIIIPCRNEKWHIGKLLDSIADSDYPKDRLEVLAVDGQSTDETAQIVKNRMQNYPWIKFFDNPGIFTNLGLNIGVKKSKGEIIIPMGAHSSYDKNYISQCVRYLREYNADNVGGSIIHTPPQDSVIAKAIAHALSSPFLAGNASYKTAHKGKPRWVDTVFGGCYRREVFDRIGFYNEHLFRGSDIDFNMRLKQAGGKILLVPDIYIRYYTRPSLKKYCVRDWVTGIWVIYSIKFRKQPLKPRHYIPLFFVLSLVASGIAGFFDARFFWIFAAIISAYFAASVIFSLPAAIKEKDIRYLVIIPLVFAGRHFSYGFGSLRGIIKLLTNY